MFTLQGGKLLRLSPNYVQEFDRSSQTSIAHNTPINMLFEQSEATQQKAQGLIQATYATVDFVPH